MKERVNQVEGKDKDKLKKLYKQKMMEGPEEGSKGARLGLVEMARRSGYPIEFAFEEINIIDCVMMGHKKLWSIKKERDRIYALEDMNEDEALKVSNLEIEFSDMNGYSAESDASELLLGLGISIEEQSLDIKNISPERKLKVLLAQALFGEPQILL